MTSRRSAREMVPRRARWTCEGEPALWFDGGEVLQVIADISAQVLDQGGACGDAGAAGPAPAWASGLGRPRPTRAAPNRSAAATRRAGRCCAEPSSSAVHCPARGPPRLGRSLRSRRMRSVTRPGGHSRGFGAYGEKDADVWDNCWAKVVKIWLSLAVRGGYGRDHGWTAGLVHLAPVRQSQMVYAAAPQAHPARSRRAG